MARTSKGFDLESTFARLDATISKLEDDTFSLQDSLGAFEEGIKLTRQAQKALLEAEQKVKMLIESDGEPETLDFVEKPAE
jgi:exodeoxyribonuclease VII small subunit